MRSTVRLSCTYPSCLSHTTHTGASLAGITAIVAGVPVLAAGNTTLVAGIAAVVRTGVVLGIVLRNSVGVSAAGRAGLVVSAGSGSDNAAGTGSGTGSGGGSDAAGCDGIGGGARSPSLPFLDVGLGCPLRLRACTCSSNWRASLMVPSRDVGPSYAAIKSLTASASPCKNTSVWDAAGHSSR